MQPIRRVSSIILLFLGGFCVGMQVMVAFIADKSAAGYSGRTLYFTAIAAAVLALGTWISPGRRWRELGLSILIGAAVCVGSFSVTIFLPDEQGHVMDKGELVPYLALAPGFANLVLITGLGLILFIRGGGGEASTIGRLAREAAGQVSMKFRLTLDALRGR